MSNKVKDKTKIQPADNKPSANAADKTRIAASPRQKTKPAQQAKATDDNKTRFKPANKKQLNSETDKTRIAPRAKTSSVSPDKTRLAPSKKPAAGASQQQTGIKPDNDSHFDKTRVPGNAAVPSPLESSTSTAQKSQTLLKNRFVLEHVLGAGGMGIVYKAKDLLKVEAQDRDPYVAIKVLSDEFKSHPEAFISLQRESRKSQRIAHPNIVNVFDFDRDGDTVFMTMEFLDGDPLDELISRYQTTGLPTDDCWEILQGMTSALSHAHAEHIIHSDFKPGNVFITKKGQAKVFDFGIARAVAKVEHLDDNPNDRTLFDAGNLGALTPAYASLEMLEGEEPDVRDDIYALGCVAYEMLTGQHPYNKVPADEAERQGLKPRRIAHIKKYQWKAIEKAIAFHRKDRTESVKQFVSELTPKLKSANRWLTLIAFISLAAAAVYYNYYQQQNAQPAYSEFDIRNELELKVRISFHQENIVSLIKTANYSKSWQQSLWKEFSDLAAITETQNEWIEEHKNQVYDLYVTQIKMLIEQKSFKTAKGLIPEAKRYAQDNTLLEALQRDIQLTLERAQNRKKLLALEQQKKRQAALATQRQQQNKQKQKAQAVQQKKEKKALFDVALENANTQLQCQGRLNMKNLETAITKLKQLDQTRYKQLEKSLIHSLANCIERQGKLFPERAREAKKQALRLFNADALLASIVIKSRDPCDLSLAGLGARGKRAICKDKLKHAGYGPELVVIPGNSKIKAFAIAKYELSHDDYNSYCKSSGKCGQQATADGQMPISNIPVARMQDYVKWLSRETDKKYRIPSKKEWVYAAKSRRKNLDPNRNCELTTRGFQKGGELVNTRIGKQNSWGLVNYVGNVQEWVYDGGRKLVAMGGSYRQSMEQCDINTQIEHAGKADKTTGMRVVRELQ